MTKHTIDSIAEYLREQSNGKCEILSTEYVNLKSKLLFRCECGNTFTRTLADMKKNNSFLCLECKKKKASEKYRKSMDEVIKYIEEHGCEYVSGEYTNNKSKLVLRCKCGNLFEKSLAEMYKGKNHCPECGLKNLARLKTKYTAEDARRIVREKGYTMIGEYVNAATPVKCTCKRGHETDIILSQFLVGCSGCDICAHLDTSGENHPNYHGGISKMREVLRKREKYWKKDILEKYGSKCPITGSNNVVVHHLTSFRKIVDMACEKAGTTFKPTVNQYTPEEYQTVLSCFDELHSIDSGVVIDRKIHKEYHSAYGIRNNTPEQFDEFLKEHYNTSLEQII